MGRERGRYSVGVTLISILFVDMFMLVLLLLIPCNLYMTLAPAEWFPQVGGRERGWEEGEGRYETRGAKIKSL